MKTLKLHYAMMQFLKAFTRAERVSTRQHVGYNIIKALRTKSLFADHISGTELL